MDKYLYTFGNGKAEGDGSMRRLLGGKGANLAEMNRLGLPVPSGFTLTTELCNYYSEHQSLPDNFTEEVRKGVAAIEEGMHEKFGDHDHPLLVSVRSGSPFSMPGMMDTILNLGLNDETADGLSQLSHDPEFANETYARLKHMYRDIVGEALPQDPWEQLHQAILAVFRSWNSPRAIHYRKIHRIPHNLGTGCNIQAMVYGNLDDASGTGVAFSRDPATGENVFFGEYLPKAQGEDVVAGIRTPMKLSELKDRNPEIFGELEGYAQKLEKHFHDMQDLEFTVQQGKLWMLQARNGKRTAKAAIRIAVDMVKEKMISKEEAVMRIDPEQLDQLLHAMISPTAKREVVAKGLPASPGAAVGKVVFTSEDAVEWVKKEEPVILVRAETSPDDIAGMHVAKGILTSRGGQTSHAAVVARGMGTPCVSGCNAIHIDGAKKEMHVSGKIVQEGDFITIDGSMGEVMLGEVPTVDPKMTGEFVELMQWADEKRKISVRVNADTPEDAIKAREFGAEGIGLCRTEHMFFGEERLMHFQKMIMCTEREDRIEALNALFNFQREDFLELFEAMQGLPLTIRLLDPPLHEFLPESEEKFKLLSKELKVSVDKLHAIAVDLQEKNPMLGHRGSRLGVTYPEIYEMQTRAIMEAACEMACQRGLSVMPEIELPLIGLAGELDWLHQRVNQVCQDVVSQTRCHIDYKIGIMIELPRAALCADQLAKKAEFLSFGTNDLTQTTFGVSRDDGFKFLPEYEEKGIVTDDPFKSIDIEGVGQLMKLAIERARKTKPGLEIGICGEHGGDPRSVKFCHDIGLSYVSCSPFRIPTARLAAAQAALAEKK